MNEIKDRSVSSFFNTKCLKLNKIGSNYGVFFIPETKRCETRFIEKAINQQSVQTEDNKSSLSVISCLTAMVDFFVQFIVF